MQANKPSYQSIDEYISQFSPEVQQALQTLRKVIREAAPESAEKISYGMPAFSLHGILVYFGAFKDHISFFPTSSGVEAFKNELSGYKISKGTIQIPFDKPLPLDLIKRIVKFRVAESTKKAEDKLQKKK